MRLRSVLPLLVALYGGLATSALPTTGVNILGFDDMSCAAWNKSKDDPDLRQSYIAWARGVLTGHNYALQSQQVSAVSSGTVELNINRYCRENPTGTFSDAVFRMSDQFSGRNQAIRK